jgi:hypothetical protein
MIAEQLFRTPAMAELERGEARILGALRQWVVASRSGRCPIAAAGARLGSKRAAAHLHLLLEEMGSAWPDPFAVSPPCCPRLSHDEALFAQMMAAAGQGDRPGFDRLLSDLLPGDARERLFLSARVLNGVLGG